MDKYKIIVRWNGKTAELEDKYCTPSPYLQEYKNDIFDVNAAVNNDETKENICAALDYVYKPSLYKVINGLYCLNILELHADELFKSLYESSGYSPAESYNSSISGLIAKNLGLYKTLEMISRGCMLNYHYRGELDCRDHKINDNILEKCKAHLINVDALNCSDNPNITNINMFGGSLKKLNISGKCGVNDKGCSGAFNLEELNARGNKKITTTRPFAKTLKKFYADENCGINNMGLQEASSLGKHLTQENRQWYQANTPNDQACVYVQENRQWYQANTPNDQACVYVGMKQNAVTGPPIYPPTQDVLNECNMLESLLNIVRRGGATKQVLEELIKHAFDVKIKAMEKC